MELISVWPKLPKHIKHSINLLTVNDIGKELKISKSIVYRIIRKGELEAVGLVKTGDEIAKIEL